MPKKTPTPTRGVPVTLADGKKRHLRYTLGAMREVREAVPKESLRQGVLIEDLPEVLRIGLAHAEPDITTKEIEELVDGENFEHVMRAFVQAFMGKQSENGSGKAGGGSRPKKSKKKS